MPDEETQLPIIELVFPYLEIKKNILYHDEKNCVPRDNIGYILLLAHDNKISRHFTAYSE